MMATSESSTTEASMRVRFRKPFVSEGGTVIPEGTLATIGYLSEAGAPAIGDGVPGMVWVYFDGGVRGRVSCDVLERSAEKVPGQILLDIFFDFHPDPGD